MECLTQTICRYFAKLSPPKYRATAYGIMNMGGVFAGTAVTQMLGNSMDSGNLGNDFSKLTIIVAIAVILMIAFLKPKKELTDIE